MNGEPKITELDFGIIGIPKQWSFGDKLQEIGRDYGEFEEIMKCKIHGYLIRFEDKMILLDTGLHKNVIKNPLKSLGAEIYNEFLVMSDDSNFLAYQIEKQGISSKDINYVLISHLHFDHAGALELMVNSKLIASKETINFLVKNKTKKLIDENGNQIISSSYQQKLKENNMIISIEKPYLDLFGNGRFIILRTDGHVEGHLSVVIFSYKNLSEKHFDQDIYDYLNATSDNSLNSIDQMEKFQNNIMKCDVFPFDAIFSDIHYRFEAISKISCWNIESAKNSLNLIKKLGNLPNSKIYFPHPIC